MGTCSTTLSQPRFSLQNNPLIIENTVKITSKYRIVSPFKTQSDTKFVYECEDVNTKQLWIMKRYSTAKQSESSVFTEIEIQKCIESIHVVKLHEIFKTDESVILIFERAQGKKLFNALSQKSEIDEFEIEIIFHQLVSLMAYMHRNGIMVRTLEPSNILFNGKIVKIVSLSKATFFKKRQKFRDRCSAPYFMSPEMVMGKYRSSADVWAVGVIMFILLSGRPPVQGHSVPEIMLEISNKRFNFHFLESIDFKPEVIALIKRMLDPNPRTRIKFKHIQASNWYKSFTNHRQSSFKRASIFSQQLQQFNFRNKFVRSIHAFLVRNALSQEEKERALIEFKKLDINDDGCLDKHEFRLALKKLNFEDPEGISEQIFDKLDVNHNGSIEYQEFLELWIDRTTFFAKPNLRKYFNILDNDKSGLITIDDLTNVFGDQVNSDYFKKHFKKYSNKEKMDYANFEMMIREIQPMLEKEGSVVSVDK
jgi:calcium-dependent protein kinase